MLSSSALNVTAFRHGTRCAKASTNSASCAAWVNLTMPNLRRPMHLDDRSSGAPDGGSVYSFASDTLFRRKALLHDKDQRSIRTQNLAARLEIFCDL
jgi:hypothetical protein